MSPSDVADELIPFASVQSAVGLKRTAIYRRIKDGSFPTPAKLGVASRWSRREVEGWISARLNARATS
jgi:prophage regulatory protein